MDHCAFCLHRPEPLLCRWEGDLRLEAADGPRRLLGVFSPQGESLLHFVELGGETRTWPDGDGLTRAVTVYNRSSLPMDWVGVEPSEAIQPGSLRIEGQLAEAPELPGLAAGGQALLTWHESAGTAPQTIGLRYRYTFAGEIREDACPI
ncbi:hypothetical protein [Intestinimonas butyriciproducens]|mgnify:FL=1|uniref:Uncharacterized protein n=1 Tax=Candidatus Intestinimonas merdavium TaxID=2838622 RepID=A0A9D2CE18_9FIRM|nr:hypothetical protein [Intestinimonas butyriciproducens]MBM6977311.1 hypothetical protein [Intestinimonas butyriciproducens]HIY73542.1 hypothetical protein [Candidatus Intestinimonas merdavium]